MKLPPYGLQLKEKLASNKKILNDIFTFCGVKSWEKARAHAMSQTVLCLPYMHDPFDYDWPVSGLPILLFETGGLHITETKRIAYCLLLAQAAIVRVILSNNQLVIYRTDLT